MGAQFSYAQNLILNPSFEAYNFLPEDQFLYGTEWPVKDWKYGMSPDYFHFNATGSASVPNNFAGFTAPAHGDAYVGILLNEAYSMLGPRKEFVVAQLKEPLIAGELYHFSGYYQVATYSHLIGGTIGVLFKDTCDDKVMHESLFDISQIPIMKTIDLYDENDQLEWNKISGTYEASGGEKFIYIGKVSNTQQLELYVNKNKVPAMQNNCYVYLDHMNLWKEGSTPPDTSIHRPDFNEPIVVNDIVFEFNSYKVRDTLSAVLAPLVEHLLRKPKNSYVLMVTGHTDDIGSEDYNYRLSLLRAREISKFLINSGIPKNLVKTFGKGENEPLIPNSSDENRSINRRVEINVRYLE